MSNRIWILLAIMGGAWGCSSSLETGYVPRKLGATDTERRGYYADPYSPEARAAQQDHQAQTGLRRPTPGY